MLNKSFIYNVNKKIKTIRTICSQNVANMIDLVRLASGNASAAYTSCIGSRSSDANIFTVHAVNPASA